MSSLLLTRGWWSLRRWSLTLKLVLRDTSPHPSFPLLQRDTITLLLNSHRIRLSQASPSPRPHCTCVYPLTLCCTHLLTCLPSLYTAVYPFYCAYDDRKRDDHDVWLWCLKMMTMMFDGAVWWRRLTTTTFEDIWFIWHVSHKAPAGVLLKENGVVWLVFYNSMSWDALFLF